MASLTRWTWVWVNSGSWWWTGRPAVLRFMGSQRVGHDWTTELNWTETRSWSPVLPVSESEHPKSKPGCSDPRSTRLWSPSSQGRIFGWLLMAGRGATPLNGFKAPQILTPVLSLISFPALLSGSKRIPRTPSHGLPGLVWIIYSSMS